MDPNFQCRPYWRKTGCLSEDDLGIFATMLKGEMCSGNYLSIERGTRKCSGIRDSMASYISAINYIHPQYARYAYKTIWGCYSMQATGAGAKRCFVPEVRYMWSGLDEKALRRWVTSIFRNLGAHYTVRTFLWLWAIFWSSYCLSYYLQNPFLSLFVRNATSGWISTSMLQPLSCSINYRTLLTRRSN